MTPAEIINQALKKSGVLGVGQTASAEDVNDAMVDLNGLIAQWRRNRWLVYVLRDAAITVTGARSYTVGPGGDFDVARPDRLEAAFTRQFTSTVIANAVDYTMEILQSREDYNRIALKGLTGFSGRGWIFYESSFPLGRVYPWPVPTATNLELHLSLKEDLPAFTSLTQQVQLPPEYEVAMIWNLALALRPSYQLPEDPQVTKRAAATLSTISAANFQISRLTMPNAVMGGGRYDVFSDRQSP